MATRTPPRFVPTLTEVVHGVHQQPTSAAAPMPTQEQLTQRVMQRVDLVLDRRVRETIASVVLEQTDALGPVLRERLEEVVREAVAQALADELKSRQRDGGPGV
jgi:hypothetical protein